MYLIPKNIKVKREIFKGFGMLELLVLGMSLIIGFILQNFVADYKLKVFLFIIFPIITFFLLFPLPNGSKLIIILKKFAIFQKSQKKYKLKN